MWGASDLLAICCCLALYICLIEAYGIKEPVVDTKSGQVRGSIFFSRNGRPYMSFRGIPYAKPPIGERRFKAPEGADPWQFPLDARKEGPFCIQKNYFVDINATVTGQEDCLYLNVYAPYQATGNLLLPVMVFIHYGGFFAGRGTSAINGPEYFMDKDVVLVTFNYRLGVFGLLSTLDDAAPGNYALKDQVAVLKWVQSNIEGFGGDKQRVTIFGQSAGSGSVHGHILSPASKGLFSGAISQSGVALDLWFQPQNELQRNITKAQALFVNCGHFVGNSTDLIRCLRAVDASTLAESADSFKYFDIEPPTPFTPVIEKRTKANPNPFFTKQPLKYIQERTFQQVPWIIGLVQDEGILRASALIRQHHVLEGLNANFDRLLPQMLALSASTTDVEPLWKNGLIDVYSDRAFIYGLYQSVQIHTRKSGSPLWVYAFNYRGQHTYGDVFAKTNNDIDFHWGVCHCDDLLYLFRTPEYFPDLQNVTDLRVSRRMLEFWTNFATYGTPDPFHEATWTPVKIDHNNDFDFLNITGSAEDGIFNCKIDKGLFKERIQFWANQTLNENFDFNA